MLLSDTKSFFSKNHGWAAGMGDRNGRWAIVVDKDGKAEQYLLPLRNADDWIGTIVYAEVEPGPGVTVSLVSAVGMVATLIRIGLRRGGCPVQVVSTDGQTLPKPPEKAQAGT